MNVNGDVGHASVFTHCAPLGQRCVLVVCVHVHAGRKTSTVRSMERRARMDKAAQTPGEQVDLHQVVAYNLRAARAMRGWTQEDLAGRLEAVVGVRPSQATISALERSWDSRRPRREFDVQDLAVFAMAFDLPMLWFLLPPPGDRREVRDLGRTLADLYVLLLGRNDQLDALYQRLREIGAADATPVEEAFGRITGTPTGERPRSYRDRREALLLALLDRHADGVDEAAESLADFFAHLRQIGIRGYIAEATGSEAFLRAPGDNTTTTDETSGTANDQT